MWCALPREVRSVCGVHYLGEVRSVWCALPREVRSVWCALPRGGEECVVCIT